MKKEPGGGLAANQIGVVKQIVTIHIKDKKKKIEKLYILFKPIIIKYSKEKVIMEEGCLSVAKQCADIERPVSITL